MNMFLICSFVSWKLKKKEHQRGEGKKYPWGFRSIYILDFSSCYPNFKYILHYIHI